MIKRIEQILTICLACLTVWLAYDVIREAGDAKHVAGQESAAPGHAAQGMPAQIPARYDARDNARNPQVKNQGTLGTCWAVAASSALEAYFLPQERLVFSADHLSMQNSFVKAQDDGGDYTMVMAYLSSWQGPVLEADDPYGDGVSVAGLPPVRHVQEMQMPGEKDYRAIKQAILSCGAVQSSIYMDLENAFSSSVYYNQLQCSYYYDGDETVNHDIIIIGWDDYYDASRFNRKTAKNGAFICQNSWGGRFGDDGIFYVSYEDVNIGLDCIAYTDIEETDNYDHIYQSDLCGWVGQLGYGDETCYFANVYEASGAETLEAVGFYTTGKNTEYEIYLIEDFQNEASLSGTMPVTGGTIREKGYYTVRLPQAIELEAGQRYAVLVYVDTPGAEYPVATEYAADEETKTVAISDGEGYISHNGISWTRTEEEHQANVCLKAYTKDR